VLFRSIDFGIETVRMPKEGVYEINLDALMQKRPLIVLEKGKIYLISLPTIFDKVKKRF
jgi:predicted  nucleic acid-binding Zn-ribbon protein